MIDSMRRMAQVIALIAAVWVAIGAADQNNNALDALFDRLHKTSDSAEAAHITQQIWNNWYQNDNPKINSLMVRGELSMRGGYYDDAIAYFSEIIELEPEFAEGWNRRATAYYVIGEYRSSTEDVSETLRLEPRHFGALSGQGLIYMQLNDADQALNYMEKALEVNPHMAGVKQNIQQIKKLIHDEVI